MRFGTLTKLLALLMLASPVAHATNGEDFVIYEAMHRSADELKKAAEGVTNGARVTSMGSKMVVYGTKSQRDGVLKVFAELDHALGNYSVQLRLASRSRAAKEALGVGGTVSSRGAAVNVTTTSFEGEAANNSIREITVSDGGTAKLYGDAGIYPRTVAVHLRAIGHSGAHVEIRENDANAVGEQAIVTELDVPLGEWRSVGAITGDDVVRTGEIVARTKRSSMSSQDVQMRVNLLP